MSACGPHRRPVLGELPLAEALTLAKALMLPPLSLAALHPPRRRLSPLAMPLLRMRVVVRLLHLPFACPLLFTVHGFLTAIILMAPHLFMAVSFVSVMAFPFLVPLVLRLTVGLLRRVARCGGATTGGRGRRGDGRGVIARRR